MNAPRAVKQMLPTVPGALSKKGSALDRASIRIYSGVTVFIAGCKAHEDLRHRM